MRRLMFAALAVLSLGGCATIVAPLSDQPMDQHHGKRTVGAKTEDRAIEFKTRVNLKRASEDLAAQRVVPVSYNRNLLLVGQVATPELKVEAGRVAEGIRNVRHVHNELEVRSANSSLARVNDSWLTFKVRLRLMFDGAAPSRRTLVTTENGVVYLMGLLTRDEADAVVAQARKVYGVQKIVKIIEYIDNP